MRFAGKVNSYHLYEQAMPPEIRSYSIAILVSSIVAMVVKIVMFYKYKYCLLDQRISISSLSNKAHQAIS